MGWGAGEHSSRDYQPDSKDTACSFRVSSLVAPERGCFCRHWHHGEDIFSSSHLSGAFLSLLAVPLGLWSLPAPTAWQQNLLAGRSGWCHAWGRCGTREKAAGVGGMGTHCDPVSTSAGSLGGSWHCGITAIHPGARKGLLGLPALMGRDLQVPRLSLLLTTFPSCSHASIVLPLKRLPPAPACTSRPSAFTASLWSLLSCSEPCTPSSPIAPLFTPQAMASLAGLPRRHRSSTQIRIRAHSSAGLTLSAAGNLSKELFRLLWQ